MTEQELQVKDPNYVAPPREQIREELKKVSNFTDAELSIMYWSSMYKAHSLIVKYGQQGVEEKFRQTDWFKEALKNYTETGQAVDPAADEKKDEKDLTKEEKRELRKKEKEAKRQQKEEDRKAREEERERKKRVKDIKAKFADLEFRIHEFYGFINEIAKSKDKNFELTLIDKALIQVKRDGKMYVNILIDNGEISFKRGDLE